MHKGAQIDNGHPNPLLLQRIIAHQGFWGLLFCRLEAARMATTFCGISLALCVSLTLTDGQAGPSNNE